MANAHNMMVRGLNAIYLQAPHIQPKDEKDFCTFITHWQKLITTHHRGEEELAFPKIEAMSGVKGLMDRNLEQHHAFHDGLAAMGTFATEVISGKTKYDGAKLIGIIDDFGPIVVQHLADEIPTISNLREYGDEKMGGLPKMMEEEGAKATVSTAPYINLFVFIFSFAPLLPADRLPTYILARKRDADCSSRRAERPRLRGVMFLLRHVGYPLRGRPMDQLASDTRPHQVPVQANPVAAVGKRAEVRRSR